MTIIIDVFSLITGFAIGYFFSSTVLTWFMFGDRWQMGFGEGWMQYEESIKKEMHDSDQETKEV